MSECGEVQIAGGKWKSVSVYICGFPDNEPGRFVDAPLWLLKQVGGGQIVMPDCDCQNCPAFKVPTS
jgi:hypothetical protein